MEWFFIGLFLLAIIGAALQHFGKAAEQERQAQAELGRKSRLAAKYSGDQFEKDIVNGLVRVGMTAEQLRDAWGPPVTIDERVLKTKVAHTYKYAQTGARSFRQRVKVENGIVVGWTNT